MTAFKEISTKKRKQFDFLWIELTQKCNLACVHCYNNSGPFKDLRGSMSYEDWCRVIQEAHNQGCESIQFIGGEATMHPDLSKLIRFTKKLGYTYIELFTNLTIINKDLLACIKENEVDIAGSMYSNVDFIHDSITTRIGSFKKAVDGIKQILKADIPIRIGIIEMEENEGQVDDTIAFLEDLGVKNIGVDKIRNYGRADHDIEMNESFDGLCGECWKGKLCVTSTGEAHPCIMSRMVIAGNVLNQSIDQIIDSDQLQGFQEIMKEKFAKENDKFSIHAGSCTPDRPKGCSPDREQCSPCHPNSVCGPNKCQPTNTCQPKR